MRLPVVMPAALLKDAFRADGVRPLAEFCQSVRRRFIAVEGFLAGQVKRH